jgi:hypothetical protein
VLHLLGKVSQLSPVVHYDQQLIDLGSAVYLYGNVGPDYGSATVSLNDKVAESSINLTVSISLHDLPCCVLPLTE